MMLVNEHGCPFCNEFNGRKELSYFEVMFGSKYDIPERLIFESDHFACVPSIGSFVEGYLLVIPKQHFLSSLSMPKENIQELMQIVQTISAFFQDSYQTGFLMFEHGTADADNAGGMSVVHAHLHLVPCQAPIISALSEFEFLKFDSLYAARDYYQTCCSGPYLLLRDTDSRVYLAMADEIPSQYFRKKVCDLCGVRGTGDWKEYPYLENVKKTIAAAKRFKIEKNDDGEECYGTAADESI